MSGLKTVGQRGTNLQTVTVRMKLLFVLPSLLLFSFIFSASSLELIHVDGGTGATIVPGPANEPGSTSVIPTTPTERKNVHASVEVEEEMECWKARVVDTIMQMEMEPKQQDIMDLLIQTWTAVKNAAYKRQLLSALSEKNLVLFTEQIPTHSQGAFFFCSLFRHFFF